MYDKYHGKKAEIIDIDNKKWIGKVIMYDTPEDSENGKWWLDIDVENISNFGILSICEDEIKTIKEIEGVNCKANCNNE